MSVTGRVEVAGRRAANSRALEIAARAGFVARGAIYLLIGIIAVQVALGHGGQADRGGALNQIAGESYGMLVMWLLVVGFAGLAVWRCGGSVRRRSAPRVPTVTTRVSD